MAVQNEFDPLGASSYIAIFVAESVVFLSHLIWLARSRNVELENTSAGPTPDGSQAASIESVVVKEIHVPTKAPGVTVEEIHVTTKDWKIEQSPV